MMQEEKDKLIEFFGDESRWCKGLDAMDEQGDAIHYDDELAVSWDIVGGVCHLFGWPRAQKLFEALSRHIAHQRHVDSAFRGQSMAAMATLLDFNDDDDTTHELLMARLNELPVWRGRGTKEP